MYINKILFFLLISSMTHWLFRSMLFNFHVFMYSQFFFLFISSLIHLQHENTHCKILICLHMLRCDLWYTIWPRKCPFYLKFLMSSINDMVIHVAYLFSLTFNLMEFPYNNSLDCYVYLIPYISFSCGDNCVLLDASYCLTSSCIQCPYVDIFTFRIIHFSFMEYYCKRVYGLNGIQGNTWFVALVLFLDELKWYSEWFLLL